jgi:small subunit ribosomal protein S5
MSEEKTTKTEVNVKTEEIQKSPTEVAKNMKTNTHRGGRGKRVIKKKKRSRDRGDENQEFDKKIISIRRVTRVYKGGKRMRLSVFLVIGDKKGKVGLGLGKGADVRAAESKAYNQALKNMVNIQLKGRTIPHNIESKFKAAKVLMRPAAPGTGVIAGSSVRLVAEMAGVKDILTKQLGSSNNINNAYAAIQALQNLRTTRIG